MLSRITEFVAKGDFVVTILYSVVKQNKISFSLKIMPVKIHQSALFWNMVYLLNNLCLEELKDPGNYIDVRTNKKFRAQSKSQRKGIIIMFRGYVRKIPTSSECN